MRRFALLFTIAVLAATLANASIITSFVSVTGGPTYTWTYDATLSPDERLDPAATASAVCAGGALCSPGGLTPASGTFFTIYDFNGYGGSVTAPASWTAFTQLVGVTPSLLLPVDSATVINISFFYNGPVLTTSTIGTGVGNLGTFTITSNSNSVGSGRLRRRRPTMALSRTARLTRPSGASVFPEQYLRLPFPNR